MTDDEIKAHRRFTVSDTSYLANLDREDLRGRCVAVHHQDRPTRTERGTNISLRFPMLILAHYIEKPDAVGQKVAELLEAHWDGSFQDRVRPWMQQCFGSEISGDIVERNDRFIEEALELVQSLGYDAGRAHALVDYVFGRAPGVPQQEVGGTMVTLAALCLATGMDMHGAGEVELDRILQPEVMEKIRAKQAAKPTGSALPVAVSKPPADQTADVARLRKSVEALVGAVQTAREQFLLYERLHRAKDTPEATAKADTNAALAKRMAEALAYG